MKRSGFSKIGYLTLCLAFLLLPIAQAETDSVNVGSKPRALYIPFYRLSDDLLTRLENAFFNFDSQRVLVLNPTAEFSNPYRDYIYDSYIADLNVEQLEPRFAEACYLTLWPSSVNGLDQVARRPLLRPEAGDPCYPQPKNRGVDSPNAWEIPGDDVIYRGGPGASTADGRGGGTGGGVGRNTAENGGDRSNAPSGRNK